MSGRTVRQATLGGWLSPATGEHTYVPLEFVSLCSSTGRTKKLHNEVIITMRKSRLPPSLKCESLDKAAGEMCTLQLTFTSPADFDALLDGKELSRVTCLYLKLEVFAGTLSVQKTCDKNGGKLTIGRKAMAMRSRELNSTSYDQSSGLFTVMFAGGALRLGHAGSSSDSTRREFAVHPEMSFTGWHMPCPVALDLIEATRRIAQRGTADANRSVQQT